MKGFFAGSFNPFTKGHLDILSRGLRICPEGVVVGMGYNENKCSRDEAFASAEALSNLLAGIPGVEVAAYSGLTVDAARRHGAELLIRGFRNAIDAEYERSLADTNRMIAGIDTILLAASPELAPLSSSMVRELAHNGYDVGRYLPTREECREACGMLRTPGSMLTEF